MLELARCQECGQVKLCIPSRGVKVKGEERIPYVNHYCPECDEAIDEFIDRELERDQARRRGQPICVIRRVNQDAE